MALKRVEASDLAVPSKPATINGKEYKMCFDLGSLFEAEQEINKGLEYKQQIDILAALPRMNGQNTLLVFAASLRRFHPEISFEEAKAIGLSDLPALYEVRDAVNLLWIRSVPEVDPKANPTGASEDQVPSAAGNDAGSTSGASPESV